MERGGGRSIPVCGGMSIVTPFTDNRLNIRRPFVPRYKDHSLLHGLQAWWSMGNATMAANYAADVGGITLSHSATELTPNVDGLIGKCVSKTDGNYGYLYENAQSLSNMDKFTAITWLKFPDFPTEYEVGYRNPLGVGAQDIPQNLWRFRIIYSIPQKGHPTFPDGDIINLWLYYYNPSDEAHGYQSSFSILYAQPNTLHVGWLSNWHMIACRYDGNTITGNAFYNTAQFEVSREIGTLATLANANYYAFWPARYMGCASLGQMFGVWNRALSDRELSDLWNGGAGFAYPFN